MWRKRQRYIFMKRSERARTVWLLTGFLVIIGLIWFIAQLALFTENVETAKVEASRDQPEQTPAEEQPGPQTTEEQTGGTEAAKDTIPSKEEEGSKPLPIPALPAQPTPPSGAAPSPSPAFPPPSTAPSLFSYPPSSPSFNNRAETPNNPLQAPSSYTYYTPNYSDYWSHGPTYSEYWEYGSDYWGY